MARSWPSVQCDAGRTSVRYMELNEENQSQQERGHKFVSLQATEDMMRQIVVPQKGSMKRAGWLASWLKEGRFGSQC